VVAVELWVAVAVGEEGGFELGFDPGLAGGGFAEFEFEGVFLMEGQAASHLTVGEGGEGREGGVGEGARGHRGSLERVEMAVGSLTGGMRLITLQIPNCKRQRKISLLKSFS